MAWVPSRAELHQAVRGRHHYWKGLPVGRQSIHEAWSRCPQAPHRARRAPSPDRCQRLHELARRARHRGESALPAVYQRAHTRAAEALRRAMAQPRWLLRLLHASMWWCRRRSYDGAQASWAYVPSPRLARRRCPHQGQFQPPRPTPSARSTAQRYAGYSEGCAAARAQLAASAAYHRSRDPTDNTARGRWILPVQRPPASHLSHLHRPRCLLWLSIPLSDS